MPTSAFKPTIDANEIPRAACANKIPLVILRFSYIESRGLSRFLPDSGRNREIRPAAEAENLASEFLRGDNFRRSLAEPK